jgi:hypothetical protein
MKVHFIQPVLTAEGREHVWLSGKSSHSICAAAHADPAAAVEELGEWSRLQRLPAIRETARLAWRCRQIDEVSIVLLTKLVDKPATPSTRFGSG